ncbi:rRNA maturation RNase YbeY [Patescibacteria group bacterium]
MKIKLFNETKHKIPQNIIKQLEELLPKHNKKLENSSISLIIKSEKSIAELNKELFNHKGPTDVISVNSNELTPHSSQPKALLGELYICPSKIRSNAKKYKVSYHEELVRVIIHGILHLLGYDHVKAFGESREKMFKVQEALLNKIKAT